MSKIQQHEIKICLKIDTQKNGRKLYSVDYDELQLQELCYAIIADPQLSEMALMCSSYIALSRGDIEGTVTRIKEFADEIIAGNNKKDN